MGGKVSLVNQHPLENRGSGVEPIKPRSINPIREYDYKTHMNMIIYDIVRRTGKMNAEKAAEASANSKRIGCAALKPKQVKW